MNAVPKRPSVPAPPVECRVSEAQAELIDTRRDRLVAKRAAEQWGVLSIKELTECGLNAQAVRVRVANGRLHKLYRGVYAVGHTNLALEGRFIAAVKASGEGARTQPLLRCRAFRLRAMG
jgi:hypothetical protein